LNTSASEKAQRQQTTLYSFLVAIGTSVVILGLWWLTQADATPIAVQRRLSDFTLNWQCPEGHTFEHRGSYSRVPCPVCGRKSDVAVTYQCPRDGDKPALVRYRRDAHGRERVSEVSFYRGVWASVLETIHCPNCGLVLSPKRPVFFPPVHPDASKNTVPTVPKIQQREPR